MNKKKFIAAAAAFGVVASLVAVAPAANAEPVSPGLVAVGSDTLQDVLNALANGTDTTGASVRATANGIPFGNFDATEPHYDINLGNKLAIQPKAGQGSMGRPNGSGEGINALKASIAGTAVTQGGVTSTPTGLVDIARSSSKRTAAASGILYAVPFGRDAFAYAYKDTTPSAALANLTLQQLKEIFECTLTTIGGETVKPVIPQAGSGSRKDFLKIIGVDPSGNGALGADSTCVKVGQEHDSRSLAENEIMPMSAAQWVTQNNFPSLSRLGADVVLGSPISGASPVTGTAPNLVPNQSYYDDDVWGRDTFLLVSNDAVTAGTATYNAGLANLVGTASSKLGHIGTSNANFGASPASTSAVKKKFGFLRPKTVAGYRTNG